MENNYNIEFDYHFYFMGMIKIEFYVVSTRFFLPDQKILFVAEVIAFWNLVNIGNYNTLADFNCDLRKMTIFGISKPIFYIFNIQLSWNLI